VYSGGRSSRSRIIKAGSVPKQPHGADLRVPDHDLGRVASHG
jgi:hypothetical protein